MILSLGALVTTHKIDLYEAAKDLFDYLDPYAQLFGELSSISKKDGLEGHAKDPISCGFVWKLFIPLILERTWGRSFHYGSEGALEPLLHISLTLKKREICPANFMFLTVAPSPLWYGRNYEKN